MLGIADVQAAVIARLKAVEPTTDVPSDIAEFNYEGTQYAYPCVRVRISPITPHYRTNSCQPVTVAIEVIAYSESPSSLEVSGIAKAVENNLGNFNLTVEGKKSTPIRIMQVVGPVPLSPQRGWAEHVLMECEIPTSL